MAILRVLLECARRREVNRPQEIAFRQLLRRTMYVQDDRVLHQRLADTTLDCHDRVKALGQTDQGINVEPGDNARLAGVDQGLRHGRQVVQRLISSSPTLSAMRENIVRMTARPRAPMTCSTF